jgi:hypothetical protein
LYGKSVTSVAFLFGTKCGTKNDIALPAILSCAVGKNVEIIGVAAVC